MATRVTSGPLVRLSLALAFLAFIFIGMNDGVGGVLLPSLEQHYGLDKGGVSGLFFSGSIGYLLAALSSGPLTRLLGQRRFLTLGSGCLVFGMGLAMLAPPWPLLLAAMAVVGLGMAVVDAGLNTYVAGLPNNSARLNDLHAFYGGGALVGPLLASGLLAVGAGWNTVYGVLAVCALLLVGGFAVIFPTTPAAPAPSASAPREGNVLRATLRLPMVWLGAALLAVYVGLEVSVGSWAYSVLTESRGVAPGLAGALVSGYWLGLTAGRVVLGRVAGRWGNGPVIAGSLGGTVLGLLVWGLAPGTAAAGLGLLVAGFSLGPIFPTMIALAATFVPSRLLPSAIGFMASMGAGGASLFPWLAGQLAARLGLPAISAYALALSLVLLAVWGGFSWRLRREAEPET